MSHTKNKKQETRNKKQKGVSLLFIVLITSLILAIGLGISALLIQEMRIMGEIGYSVIAFYAADSGIEAAIYDLYTSSTSSPPIPEHSDSLDNVDLGEAHYNTLANCCDPSSPDCSLEPSEDWPSGCPLGADYIDPNCDALNYCLKSAGSYKGVKRAIEIKY